MMNRYKAIYYFALLALLSLTACQDNDSAELADAMPDADGKVAVRIHLRVAGQNGTPSANTRATWTDPNATDDEMMNVWTVIAVYAEDDTHSPKEFEEGEIAFIHASMPDASEREIDDLVYLKPGKYMFYSFANMEPGTINGILGIPDTEYYLTPVNADGSLGTTIPFPSGFFYIGSTDNDHRVYSLNWGNTSDLKILLHEYSDSYDLGVAGKTASVNGNGFDLTANNGFNSKGIPMSNVQSATITNNTTLDLIVVRMMAKMELQVTNSTGKNITVESVTLSNITQNREDTNSDNLMLLPRWTSSTGKDIMNVLQHGDLQPNLSEFAEQADYVHPINKTIANGATETVTFYINESATPDNGDGLFYLTLKLSNGSTTEYRYALIDQEKNTADSDHGKWNYIARNDYRIIPIVIDDYKLELVPYDFPAIGVYPASVKEIEDDLYEMTFHDYGHFHLVPRVTKISDNSVVGYSSGAAPTGTAWTLNTDFAGSWKTAATKGGAWLTAEQITANGFYRSQTAVTDGDDAGGAPIFYVNTSSPQWDPAGGTNYVPFIFGYIADPDAEWWAQGPSERADRQIYHEFRARLFVDGTYRRDLLYRFYMKLSADQMLSRSAARVATSHCSH